MGHTYRRDGFEADDLIATLVYQTLRHELVDLVEIVSTDKNLLQLTMWGGVTVNGKCRFDASEQFNLIKVDNLPDYKALVGDSSDNYPGVRGIGKVNATQMINEYHTLETLYKNRSYLSRSNRTKLENGREMGFLCRKLARLRYDVPIHLMLRGKAG